MLWTPAMCNRILLIALAVLFILMMLFILHRLLTKTKTLDRKLVIRDRVLKFNVILMTFVFVTSGFRPKFSLFTIINAVTAQMTTATTS